MWNVNATGIYLFAVWSDNVLRIPCRNGWQYTKCAMPEIMLNSCYSILLYSDVSKVHETDAKDLAGRVFIIYSHEYIPEETPRHVLRDLSKLICI